MLNPGLVGLTGLIGQSLAQHECEDWSSLRVTCLPSCVSERYLQVLSAHFTCVDELGLL